MKRLNQIHVKTIPTISKKTSYVNIKSCVDINYKKKYKLMIKDKICTVIYFFFLILDIVHLTLEFQISFDLIKNHSSLIVS